jgi:hypothetical protein
MFENSPHFDVLVMSNYDYIDDTDEGLDEATSSNPVELERQQPLSNFGQLKNKGRKHTGRLDTQGVSQAVIQMGNSN